MGQKRLAYFTGEKRLREFLVTHKKMETAPDVDGVRKNGYVPEEGKEDP